MRSEQDETAASEAISESQRHRFEGIACSRRTALFQLLPGGEDHAIELGYEPQVLDFGGGELV